MSYYYVLVCMLYGQSEKHDLTLSHGLQVSLQQSQKWHSGWTALLFRGKDSWPWLGWHGACCLLSMAQPLQGVRPLDSQWGLQASNQNNPI